MRLAISGTSIGSPYGAVSRMSAQKHHRSGKTFVFHAGHGNQQIAVQEAVIRFA